MNKRFIIRNRQIAERAADCVRVLPVEDKPLEVIVRPVKSKRSLDLNDYYWKLIRDIATFTGDSVDATSIDMKAEFLTPLSEKALPDGRIFVQYKSTADMGVRELTEFCEKIESFAITELGFVRNRER